MSEGEMVGHSWEKPTISIVGKEASKQGSNTPKKSNYE